MMPMPFFKSGTLPRILNQFRVLGSRVSSEEAHYENLSSLTIEALAPARNQYGNEMPYTAGRVTLTRKLWEKTNWSYFSGDNRRLLQLLWTEADLYLGPSQQRQAEEILRRGQG